MRTHVQPRGVARQFCDFAVQPPNWIVNEPSSFGFAVRLFSE